MSLQNIIREHSVQRQQLQHENEALRKKVHDQVSVVSGAWVDTVNKEVAKAFLGEKEIEAEIKVY